MKFNCYRRIKPRLSICRLVDGRSPTSKPKHIGIRINLLRWALEVTQ